MRAAPAGDTAVVCLRHVAMSYEPALPVLEDVSFSLPAGSFHFLTGASGAGKTTLLKLVYLALRPTRGSVVVLGADTTTTPRGALPQLRRKIGVIFQDCRLIEHLSVFDNAALPLRVFGRAEADVRRDVTEMLTWAGLASVLDRRPSSLSSGQQQLVSVVRAVIGRPRLLVADEPTGNVDDRMAMRLMLLFQELNRHGTTVLIATHNQHLVSRVGAAVLHLNHGGIHFAHPGLARASDLPGGERLSPARSA